MSRSYHNGGNGSSYSNNGNSEISRSRLVSPSVYSFKPLVKPSVVRPSQIQPSPGSYRREPEGIEHDVSQSGKQDSLLGGSYDHSTEYDPYQSAARQMQELLFGSTPSTNPGSSDNPGDSSPGNDLLKPSSNSAFEKYVPSTADINTKMNAKSSYGVGLTQYPSDSDSVIPKRADSLKGTSSAFSSWNQSADFYQGHGHQGSYLSRNGINGSGRLASQPAVNFNPLASNKYSSGNYNTNNNGNVGAKSPKVARFCHECGNPFALPGIRFCCECGVKRLYC